VGGRKNALVSRSSLGRQGFVEEKKLFLWGTSLDHRLLYKDFACHGSNLLHIDVSGLPVLDFFFESSRDNFSGGMTSVRCVGLCVGCRAEQHHHGLYLGLSEGSGPLSEKAGRRMKIFSERGGLKVEKEFR
jgi:hypothetical protein